MKYLPLSALLLLSSPVVVSAQTAAPSELTLDQVSSIMKQLDQIEQQITKNRSETLTSALARFKMGAANPKAAIDLYVSCYKLVNFDRKNLKQADFQAWEDSRQGFLKDPNVAAALQHQLEYLTLTIQAQDAEDTATLIPALQGFVGRVITTVQSVTRHSASGAVEARDNKSGARPGGGPPRPGGPGPGGQLIGLLRTSVRNNEFNKAFQLDNYLTKKDWEYEPLNIAGIYDKVIFPYYVKEKTSEVTAQWDARISAELALNKALQSETEYQVYYTENFPQLQWSKAQYLLKNKITPVTALADMLKIIRENPTHSRAASWLQELRQNVNANQPSIPSPGASETLETASSTPPAPAAVPPASGN